MAHRPALNRILESFTTTGTGNVTVGGAQTGYRSFGSLLNTNDTFKYAMWAVDSNGNPTGDWEYGKGTYNGSNVIARTTVLDSSNAGSAVSWSAGTKYAALVPDTEELRFMPTAILGSDVSSTSTTHADVSGMTFEAEASATYEVEFFGVYQSAATTTGIAVGIDVPASATVCGMCWTPVSSTALGSALQRGDATTTGATASVDTATSDVPLMGKWIVVIGATAGTVQLTLRTEVSASQVTLKANRCFLKARRIA